MSLIECAREAEVLEKVESGSWTENCDQGLRDHWTACAVCSDVIEVARSVQDDYAVAAEEARIPSSSLVYWRAELRAKREAVRTASRPITLVQALAAAAGLGTIAALAGLLLPMGSWFGGFLSTGMELLPQFELQSGELIVAGFSLSLPFMLGAAGFLMLTSMAAYWILAE